MADSTAILVSIADAVKDAINTAALTDPTGQPATATRMYLPRFGLTELDTLRVTVVPKSVDLARLDRTSFQEDYSVDVAVQKRVANDAECDDLMLMAQQIVDLFKTARLTISDACRAALVKVEPVPYWPDHLKDMRLFTNVQTLTFRIVR